MSGRPSQADAPAKRPAHRPPLPPEQRQDAMIRERVTQAQREAYEAAGGKVWLLQQLRRARGRQGP